MPCISVVIPAYNAESTITRATKSVLTQNCAVDCEIIIVDDRSSDRTGKVVSEIAAQHPQVRYMSNCRAKGPAGARNTGLLAATGEYIAFLDADDIWLPNHLSQGMSLLQSNCSIDAVFFNFELRQERTDKFLYDWFSARSFRSRLKHNPCGDGFNVIVGDLFDALLDESFIHLQSLIIRKESIEGVLFNERVFRSEDRDFCVRLYRDAKARFAFKNVITGTYFRSDSTLTSESIENSLSTLLDQICIFSGYLSDSNLEPGKKNKIKKLLSAKYRACSYSYRSLEKPLLAASSLFKSMRYGLSTNHAIELAKITASMAGIHPIRRQKHQH